MPTDNKNMLFLRIFIIGCLLTMVYFVLLSPGKDVFPVKELGYDEFLSVLADNKSADTLLSIKPIANDQYQAMLMKNVFDQKNKEGYSTNAPSYSMKALEEIAQKNGVKKTYLKMEVPGFWVSWLPLIIYLVLFFFIWSWLSKRQMGGGGGLQGFTKKNHKVENAPKVSFKDVAGIDEAKAELEEVVAFLRNPARFSKLGAKVPRGVLLAGLPGTGKTLLAKATAGEAGVSFFSMSGSEFVEMFVGVGAARVRDLFEQAKKNAPAIVFIDEVDAMGKARGAGVGQTHNEGEQTLQQLFTEMDGFEVTQGIVVLAATNRPDTLDPALLRPGRFDRHVEVPLPDVVGREAIIKVHTRDKPLAKDVDLSVVARATPRFSGADIENLCNLAATLATRKDKNAIETCDFMDARETVIMGEKRRSLKVSEEERRITAIHEAGHALVGMLLAGTDPLHCVTIIPRGRAMGITSFLPEEDRFFVSKENCLSRIVMTLGGRIAEEVILGENKITTGAGNDLLVVTDLARRMVCDWAMSKDLPMRTFGERQDMIFLGRELGRNRDYSEGLADKVDGAIQRIIDNCAEKTKEIILDNKEKLLRISEALLEKETLNKEDVLAIINC